MKVTGILLKRSLIGMVAIFNYSCGNKDSLSGPSLSSTKGESCISATACTKELGPVKCKYHEKIFEASNICEASNEIREYACTMKMNYDESEVSCNQKTGAAAKHEAKPNDGK